jgi:hypothetical protein
MLLKKVPLLTNQIVALEELNNTYVKQDSLRIKEIDLYKNAYEERDLQYNKLNKKYKCYKTYSILGGIAAFVLGILVCR